MIETIHRAKYLLADPYTLIPNGSISILEDGRISGIASWNGAAGNPPARVVDWGASVLLPGLINAHVHLELTSLYNRVKSCVSFTDWLSKLIAERSSMATTALKASIAKGIDLSLSSGTTTIGDISSTGLVRSAAYNSPIRKVIFEESIALSPNQAQEKVAEVERALETAAADDLFRQGVSPHAPYTASGQLYQGLAALARSRKIPLATHTAETEAEIQFLSTGTGEFRDFLLNMNALPGDWNPPRTSPVSYLHSLGVLKTHCLLIHCNYLDQASIELIAESGNSVVYCPRSHAFFGHGKHPVRRLLDAGIRVALGTDSLASNASLSILDEMRFLAQKRTDLKTEEILKAATVNGANALNLGDETGQLKPGSRADITVLEVPSGMKESKFVEQILEGSGECIGTIIGGNIAWRRKDRT